MKKVLIYASILALIIIGMSVWSSIYESSHPKDDEPNYTYDLASETQQYLDSIERARRDAIILENIMEDRNQARTHRQQVAESPEEAYQEGYDEGFTQGVLDADDDEEHGANYDDSNSYYDYYEEMYIKGYEEGYDDGYQNGGNK